MMVLATMLMMMMTMTVGQRQMKRHVETIVTKIHWIIQQILMAMENVIQLTL